MGPSGFPGSKGGIMLTVDIERIRTKWKDRMLMLAYIVSGWSVQPEGQRHGCVLAVDGKLVIATGFNGPDRNYVAGEASRKCGCDWCGEGRVVHAEENAILNARQIGAPMKNLVAYVSKRPCADCHRQLLSAGCQAIFWLQGGATADSMWTVERHVESQQA